MDLLIATTDYERAAIEHVVRARIEEREIRVLTPEDLIVYRLVAGRARDFEAVAAIINAYGSRLDVEYVTGWLEQFDRPDAWAPALDDARREAGG